MIKYMYILLDLDGTLTDPAEGITNSLKHALNKYGISAQKSELLKFIGPPLRDSFMEYYSFSPEKAEEAVAHYREYFSVKGIYENSIYPGITEMLNNLRDEGRSLLLATSKPSLYAVQVLEHFNIAEYFDFIAGSNMDGTMGSKAEVVEYALSTLSDAGRKSAVMTGDRKYDIEGAISSRIDSIGVTWGYGTREELVSAGASYIADSVSELESILLA